MNELQIFQNEEFGEIRTTKDGKGNVLFCGTDVAKALGYSVPTKAVNTHCKGVSKMEAPSKGGNQQMLFIPESDLYRLIVKSKLPSAERFECWVFEEVLPSIRKYGGYVTEETLTSIFQNPDNLHVFLANMLKVSEENRKLKQEVGELQTKGEYFDNMIDTGLLINFRTTAKEIGVKPMFLIHFLLENKYLYRDLRKVLLPYQHHVESGLFEIVEFCRNGHTGVQTLVTTTGRNYFLQLYLDGDMDVGSI
ncbi:BRO family protein [Chakrabartyella piscis]|uniref:BRO family protein n=1 Tax=Chakrabartyella piscis TaxID=2918914 RepID=UPI00295832FF|nr:BRO family protein [Chakrabartyella piscis]